MTMINDVHVSPEYVWSAGQLSLDVPATMEFTDPKELGVYVNGVPLAASKFTVQKKDGSDAYAVSFVTAPAVGDRIVIARACKFDQPVNLHNYQAYDREVVERMFDRLTQMCGELKERLGRAVLARIGISDADFEKWVAGVVEPNRLTVGTVSTGEDAAASISGEAPNLVLNLTLPKGDKGDTGPANMLQREVICATADSTEAASAFISGTYPDQQLNLRIPKGEKGAKGDPGDDGISPTATVTQTAIGATITITDAKNGTTTANIANGKDGGYTLPAATTTTLGGVKVGARMSIDSNGVLSADEQSSSYTLPVASATTLGGVKSLPGTSPVVINSDGTINIKRNQKQFINPTTLELYIADDSGLEVPNTAQGGLRIKQIIQYTTLSGTSVSIKPAFNPYKLNATAATTLNVSGTVGPNTNYIGYAEIVITVGESGSITAGENFTLVDSLLAGKTNYCVVRWEGNQAKLFVWRVE